MCPFWSGHMNLSPYFIMCYVISARELFGSSDEYFGTMQSSIVVEVDLRAND